MQIYLPGNNESGFILLKDLLIMFVVIICFAVALSSMAVVSNQGSRLLKNVQAEIETKNEIILKRVN